MGLNFITLFMILALFVVEYWREIFLIDRFEINDDKIDGNLKRNVFSRGKYLDLQLGLQRCPLRSDTSLPMKGGEAERNGGGVERERERDVFQ